MLARVLLRALMIVPAAATAVPALAQTAGLVHGEALGLARLTEARSISRRFDRHIWPGFDAGETPAVVFQPGGWAIAAGFPEAPEGFEPIPGILDGERQVYRISRAGGFPDPGRSPALVSGRWSVVSRFDPPPVIPEAGYLGRPSVEEAVARLLGDAFMIYLMEKRGLDSPFPSGIPVYPDSAELTALTSVENRLLLETARMVNLDENSFPEFKRIARQIVAVRRERWRMMGPATAALEAAVENSYGMGDLVEQSVHRMAIQGGFLTRPIFEEDPTYQKHGNSLLLRLISTNYAMSRTPDNPAATVYQIAARARVLGFLLNRIDARLGWRGLEGGWRESALSGKEPLIDLLAGGDESRENDPRELLEQAKKEQGYLAFLRLAREDLVRLIRDREPLIDDLFPSGGTLEIALGKGQVSLDNDMASTIHMGTGRSLHTGRLDIGTTGLDLHLEEYPPSGRPRVMTFLDLPGGRLAGIRVRLEGLRVTLGDQPISSGQPGTPGPDRPLGVEGPGLRLEARGGRLSRSSGGGLILTLE